MFCLAAPPPMNRTTLAGLLVLVGLASPAAAQSTRVFADAQCSYTLPDKDWVWLDPKAVEALGPETIALAGNADRLVFSLRVQRLKPDEQPGRKYFESYEAGLTADGRVRSVGRRHREFRGVPAYQIDVETASGNLGTILILVANERHYELYVHRRETAPTADEVRAVFGKFALAGQATGPEDDGTDEAFERGARAGAVFNN